MRNSDYCEICYETLIKAADGRFYCPVCEESKIQACDNYRKRFEYREKKLEQKEENYNENCG